MTKFKNIIEKIWDAHVVCAEPGHPQIFRIDTLLMHEVTSAQAFTMLREKNISAYKKLKALATVDHSIPTTKDRWKIHDPNAAQQVEEIRKNVVQYGIDFREMDSGSQGIIHMVGAESGIIFPGSTVACGDSHTSTHGAFGAIAFGVGTSEVGHILATGCILQPQPKTMRVEFRGKPKPYVFSKDLILALIAKIGISGANGHLIEYTGDCLQNMSLEERMTICNMSIECGARAGLIAPDEKTFDYIFGKQYAPVGESWEQAVEYWKTLKSDVGCSYDKEIIIDVGNLEPMVTWGINPGMGIEITETIPLAESVSESSRETYKRAYEYTKLQGGSSISGTPIDYAFFGSCTNARIPDFALAAKMLAGKKIHSHVHMIIVPGSEKIKRYSEEQGWDKIFTRAGAEWRNPGCSACLGMNDDKIPSGKRCISTSNRNFIGRQGPGSITHLASPATVIASAVAGVITSPKEYISAL